MLKKGDIIFYIFPGVLNGALQLEQHGLQL